MDTLRALGRNSAAMRRHLLPGRTVGPGVDVCRGEDPPLTWITVWEPTPVLPEGALAALAEPGPVTVDDPFGQLERSGFTRHTWPIMRRPAAAPPLPAHGQAQEVTDREELAVAERVIVDGFPMPALRPFAPSRFLPADLIERPGWRAWTARRGGVAAAACLTFDDGDTVGVYWLATLPEHRSRGLGREVMSALARAHEAQDLVLVATEAGEPLYTSMGFTREGVGSYLRRTA